MLGETDAPVEYRHYFKEKPSEAEVRELAAIAPGGVQALVSPRSVRYRELGLATQTLSDDEWVALLAREPGIWRRPIAVKGNRMVIGFDREALEALTK